MNRRLGLYHVLVHLSRLVNVAALALLFSVGCTGDSDETLNCDDLAPADQATYADVAALVAAPSAKSCSRCHNTQTPIYGYNFEGSAVAYDALSTKMDRIYPQVASGRMPQIGTAWDENDLRLLRTWYCNGAFFED